MVYCYLDDEEGEECAFQLICCLDCSEGCLWSVAAHKDT